MLDSASGTDLSDSDECPPLCTNFVYEATVSSSRLSDMMIHYYVSHGNNDSAIGRRYVNAVETKNRVASTLLRDIIGHLQKLVTAYQRLKAMLATDLIEHTTSVPGQIHVSISTIVQQTHDSLAEFSSQIVGEFTDYYKQNMDFSVARLVRSAQSILSQHFYFAKMDANNTDDFDIDRIEKMFDYEDAFCNDWHVVNHALLSGGNFSTKLTVDRTCSNDADLYYCGYYLAAPMSRNDTDYSEKLVQRYQGMTASARKILECVQEYDTFLKEVQLWLKSALAISSSLPLQSTDSRYVLLGLEHELNWLKKISHKFAQTTMVRSFIYVTRKPSYR